MNIETERKYLIKLPDFFILDSVYGAKKAEMLQTYLKKADDGAERRIRKITENGKTSFIYTKKTKIDANSRFEDEKAITKDEYTSLYTEREAELSKVRYSFPYADHIMEIDVYPADIGGELFRDSAILEVELSDFNENIDFPPEITVIKEVTGMREYSNRALAC